MTCEPRRGCKPTDSPVVATVAPRDSMDPKLPEEEGENIYMHLFTGRKLLLSQKQTK